MKKSRFTDQQIAFARQQAESGTSARRHFFWWKKVYGDLMPSEVRKLSTLEERHALHRDQGRAPRDPCAPRDLEHDKGRPREPGSCRANQHGCGGTQSPITNSDFPLLQR